MKILILVTRNQLFSQQINSWHKKSSPVTRNQFLPQEIHSYHKKSILVKRHQFLWSHILWLNYFINTQQRVKPTKKFAWTFRGNLIPRFPGNSPPWLNPSLFIFFWLPLMEMEFHMINMYTALPMCAETEKTTFLCKDDCILTKHTRRWTYSPLRLQYNLCRTSLLNRP